MQFDSASPLDAATRALVNGELHARVLDALDLYHSAKTAHWCVRGPLFAEFHKLFDKLADLARGQADQLAERAAALGAQVEASSKAIAEGTSLAAYPEGLVAGPAHVEALVARLRSYVALLRRSAITADGAGDLVTVNLLTDLMQAAEYLGWMLLATTQSPT